MSQKTRDSTIDQHEQHAAELREISDQMDAIARSSDGSVDATLRDLQHVIEDLATVLEEESGDISTEELNERLYPTGGAQ